MQQNGYFHWLFFCPAGTVSSSLPSGLNNRHTSSPWWECCGSASMFSNAAAMSATEMQSQASSIPGDDKLLCAEATGRCGQPRWGRGGLRQPSWQCDGWVCVEEVAEERQKSVVNDWTKMMQMILKMNVHFGTSQPHSAMAKHYAW